MLLIRYLTLSMHTVNTVKVWDSIMYIRIAEVTARNEGASLGMYAVEATELVSRQGPKA